MQNIILITLIIGLGFFLYLIKSGEIDTGAFSLKNLRNAPEFVINQSQTSGFEKSSTIKLNVQGTTFDLYTFTGSSFMHIPRSEYYMKIYNVPLEAKDAVTGTWLGSRYVFYVTEEVMNNDANDITYHIYKTEYPTDSTETVEYTQYKTIRGLDMKNTLEVQY